METQSWVLNNQCIKKKQTNPKTEGIEETFLYLPFVPYQKKKEKRMKTNKLKIMQTRAYKLQLVTECTFHKFIISKYKLPSLIFPILLYVLPVYRGKSEANILGCLVIRLYSPTWWSSLPACFVGIWLGVFCRPSIKEGPQFPPVIQCHGTLVHSGS